MGSPWWPLLPVPPGATILDLMRFPKSHEIQHHHLESHEILQVFGATILDLARFCEIQGSGTKLSWEEETEGAS